MPGPATLNQAGGRIAFGRSKPTPIRSPVVVESEATWRTLELLASTRVIITSALVLGVAALGGRFGSGTGQPAGAAFVLVATLVYFVLAAILATLSLYVHRRFLFQLVGQLTLDLAMISAMVVAGGGITSGLVILYLLPLAGASLLLPSMFVFFVCALAVIVVLFDSALRGFRPDGSESLVFQAGIYGAALFAVTGLLRLLTSRLASQERLAQIRGRDLQNQLAINRLVISQMEQGVIVVDEEARVRANNRAARRMLGLSSDAQLTGVRLQDLASAQSLSDALLAWLHAERAEGTWSNSLIQSIERGGSSQPLADLRLRARFARPSSSGTDEFVIFLEDLQVVEDRAQQLKLAAMGRLTASIAHEIRNPLSAISHAGQLMAEDAVTPLHVRLAAIVRENTLRLSRLVEDVLRVARREPPEGDAIDLAIFCKAWLAEFMRDRAVAASTILVNCASPVGIKFEQSHLRQVLYNLIDNALRYASGKPGCVELLIESPLGEERAQLWVFDDGPGVAAEVRAALFEPFYTTHARGTGLGLYLAREFCVTNRADLAYMARRDLDGSSREGFVIRFGRSGATVTGDQGFLDTMPAR